MMNKNEYFINIARTISTASKDTSSKFGAVIIDSYGSIRSTGYNSFPRNCLDSLSQRFERPEKYFWFEHAERNAIYNAARMGTSVNNCVIYVNDGLPCMDCARAIHQSGIRLYVTNSIGNKSFVERWGDNIARTIELFHEVKLPIVILDYNPNTHRKLYEFPDMGMDSLLHEDIWESFNEIFNWRYNLLEYTKQKEK